MKVVCINVGNYQGCGQRYVDRLRNMVARHLTIPHEFVCLTEKELGNDLKGWWPKMNLARTGLFDGPVMYLDLDVIITANIDHLVYLAETDTSKLWIRDDFSYSVINPKQGLSEKDKKFLGGDGCCNSSVMLWNGDALAPIWEAWQAKSDQFMSEMHGDQNVISHVMWPNHIKLLPNGSIHSYKYHTLRGHGCGPITVFHGKPKPHELSEQWAIDNWQ